MNDDFARDLTRSSRAFQDFVWPVVEKVCGGGRLTLVENSTARGLAKEFDTLAGIDAWQLLDDRGFMRGIASRVQEIRPGREPYPTFTIRSCRFGGAATEFEKRLSAIRDRDSGALYPALTIQAYVRTWQYGPLLAAGVARTVDIFNHLAGLVRDGRVQRQYTHERGCRTRGTPSAGRTRLGAGCVQGCAEFYVARWRDMDRADLRCETWPRSSRRGAA
ncbi:MAG: hypothetical protein AB7W59_01860 [Acidimicrobiia bacterium]